MRHLPFCLFVGLSPLLSVHGWAADSLSLDKGYSINFDGFPAGAAPPGWTATATGKGNPRWEVIAEPTALSKPNVLRQSGKATFPVCLFDGALITDGFVEVRFKAVSGAEDRAGGVVWRCEDADNYYVARANALEDNVAIYYVVGGKRTVFKTVSARVAAGVWHTIRVDFKEERFLVTFDGKQLFEATDRMFSRAGKVGVWTKADSVTLFDDFSYGGARY